MLDGGATPAELLGHAAALVGLRERDGPLAVDDLAGLFASGA
jgi:hypothetical protein